ncbi:MAG: hypothetical protein A2X47_13195 [Lentisphaerae bacterium GWF2_38_69]|nr:MAG: hypothetical protein A2X47_13195 [Lentisphaerae bacterium GWF2_38_69]
MDAKVLIVGTTPDYINAIDSFAGSRVLFLTDIKLRKNAIEPVPDLPKEVCSDLSNANQAISDLIDHLNRYSLSINGIACYDCESLELASLIGKHFNVFFQSSETIRSSRNKFLSKEAWKKAGLKTPRYSLLYSKEDAILFFETLESPCVLKPLSGAGSELVYLCRTSEDIIKRFEQIIAGLKARQDNRLFKTDKLVILAEEFIEGIEYSCDFMIENNSVQIIRLTQKIKSSCSLPFGIIAGYKLINTIPEVTHENLIATLNKAGTSLGINKSICMIDFIVKNNEIFLIEIAPRPGGDCLPSLLFAATEQNIIEMAINYASGCKIMPKDYRSILNMIAFRIFADKEGVLKNIDASALIKDKKVLALNLTSYPGKIIKLPPDDYDSWVLGNFIVHPLNNETDIVDLYSKSIRDIQLKIDAF